MSPVMFVEASTPVPQLPVASLMRWLALAAVAGTAFWMAMRIIPAIRKQRRVGQISAVWQEVAVNLGLQFFPGQGGAPGSVWGQTRDGRAVGISAEIQRRPGRFGRGPTEYVSTARVGLTSARSTGPAGRPDSAVAAARRSGFDAAWADFQQRFVDAGVTRVTIEEEWVKAGPLPSMIGAAPLAGLIGLMVELAERIEAAVSDSPPPTPAPPRASESDQLAPPDHCPHCGARMLPHKWVCQMCGRDADQPAGD